MLGCQTTAARRINQTINLQIIEMSSYQYEEQVLVEPMTKDVTALRIESKSQWSSDSIFHPFGHLDKLFMADGQATEILSVTMKVSSGAVQRIPAERSILGIVPLLADGSLLRGPSGFWLSIESLSSSSPSLMLEKIEKFVHMLVQKGLIVTPLLTEEFRTSWDIVHHEIANTTTYQLNLPFNGAAWSADGLQQSFRSSIGCPDTKFMGYSATEWSNLYVTGEAWNKHMWWKFSSQNQQRQVTVGLQYEQSSSKAASLLSHLESQPLESSCLLGSRNVQYVQASTDPDPNSPLSSFRLLPTLPEVETEKETPLMPLLAVDLLVRRSWPQKGRLETWITAEPLSNCSLEVRQVLPPILTPSWQTLQVTASDGETEMQMSPSLEWKDDGTSVLTLSSLTVPSSLLLSVDYKPNFLTYDDFPGDPNRGRELPPVVVTMTCPNHSSYHVHSNSALILPPTPDLSMPFNVLSLACSLYAYLVGTIITMLVKRASEKVYYKLYPDKKPKSKIQKLKEKIKSKLQRKKKSKEEDSNDDLEEESEKENEETAEPDISPSKEESKKDK